VQDSCRQAPCGELERRKSAPRPGFPTQQSVDHPEQEREERSRIVGGSYGKGVCGSPLPSRMGRMFRVVAGERGIVQLVQRPESAVAEEQSSDQEEGQKPLGGQAGEQGLF
jgi:hypothetical protein